MPADIQFTDQEATLFMVLTGMRPPLIQTATLYQAGSLASDTANRIDSELTPLIEQAIGQIVTKMNSAVAPGLADSLAQFTWKEPNYFPATSAQLRQMSDYAVSTAAKVEYMKVEAIATLASLIASLVIEAALAFFFPEFSIAAMIAEMAAVRFLLDTMLGQVIAHILSAMLIGIGIQVLLDSIAQGVLIAEHIQQTWNWEETGLSIGVGGLGGAMGLALHPIQGFATRNLAGAIEKLVGHEADNIAENLAADAGKDLADVAGSGSAKDLAGDATGHLPEGAPVEGGPKEGEPTPASGPGWKAPLAVGSREWLIENLAEIPVGIVIGGIHNAGHETLFSLFTTGQATWSWETFAGGAAQAVTRPIGVLIGGGARFAFGLPMPAENLLAGALGQVTPSMLNDIASATPEPLGDGAVTSLAGSEPGGPPAGDQKGAGGPSSGGSPAAVEALTVEPPAVQLLRAVGVAPGPDTAYQIALRTGFVPTIGRASAHSLYTNQVMVTLPPRTTSADMAAVVRPVPALPAPTSPPEPLPAYSLVDAPRPGNADQTPVLAPDVRAPEPGPSGSDQSTSLLDEPLPASAHQMPVLAPDVRAPEPGHSGSDQSTSLLDEPLPASAHQMPVLAPDTSATVTQQPPATEQPPVLQQPVTDQPVVQPVGHQAVTQPPVTRQPDPQPRIDEFVARREATATADRWLAENRSHFDELLSKINEADVRTGGVGHALTVSMREEAWNRFSARAQDVARRAADEPASVGSQAERAKRLGNALDTLFERQVGQEASQHGLSAGYLRHVQGRLEFDRGYTAIRSRLDEKISGLDGSQLERGALSYQATKELDTTAAALRRGLAGGGFGRDETAKAMSHLEKLAAGFTDSLPHRLRDLAASPPLSGEAPSQVHEGSPYEPRNIAWRAAKDQADAELEKNLNRANYLSTVLEPLRADAESSLVTQFSDRAFKQFSDRVAQLHTSVTQIGDGQTIPEESRPAWDAGFRKLTGRLPEFMNAAEGADRWLETNKQRFHDMLGAGGMDEAGLPDDIKSARTELLAGANPRNEDNGASSRWGPRLSEEDKQELWDKFSEQVHKTFADRVTNPDAGNDGSPLTPEHLLSKETARQRDLEYAYREFTGKQQQFDRLVDGQNGAETAIENGRLSSSISDKGIGRIWGDIEHVIDGLHEGELRLPLDPDVRDAFDTLDPAERRTAGLNYLLGTLGERFNREYMVERQFTEHGRSFDRAVERYQDSWALRADGDRLQGAALDTARAEFDETVRRVLLGYDGQRTVHDILAALPERLKFLDGSSDVLDAAARRFNTASHADLPHISDDQKKSIGENYRTDIGTKYSEIFDNTNGGSTSWLDLEKQQGDTFAATLENIPRPDAADAEAADVAARQAWRGGMIAAYRDFLLRADEQKAAAAQAASASAAHAGSGPSQVQVLEQRSPASQPHGQVQTSAGGHHQAATLQASGEAKVADEATARQTWSDKQGRLLDEYRGGIRFAVHQQAKLDAASHVFQQVVAAHPHAGRLDPSTGAALADQYLSAATALTVRHFGPLAEQPMTAKQLMPLQQDFDAGLADLTTTLGHRLDYLAALHAELADTHVIVDEAIAGWRTDPAAAPLPPELAAKVHAWYSAELTSRYGQTWAPIYGSGADGIALIEAQQDWARQRQELVAQIPDRIDSELWISQHRPHPPERAAPDGDLSAPPKTHSKETGQDQASGELAFQQLLAEYRDALDVALGNALGGSAGPTAGLAEATKTTLHQETHAAFVSAISRSHAVSQLRHGDGAAWQIGWVRSLWDKELRKFTARLPSRIALQAGLENALAEAESQLSDLLPPGTLPAHIEQRIASNFVSDWVAGYATVFAPRYYDTAAFDPASWLARYRPPADQVGTPNGLGDGQQGPEEATPATPPTVATAPPQHHTAQPETRLNELGVGPSWTAGPEWPRLLDGLARHAPPPHASDWPDGLPADRAEAFRIYASERAAHKTADMNVARLAARPGQGSSPSPIVEAAKKRRDEAARRLQEAERWLRAWGISDPGEAWKAAQDFSASLATGLSGAGPSGEPDGTPPPASPVPLVLVLPEEETGEQPPEPQEDAPADGGLLSVPTWQTTPWQPGLLTSVLEELEEEADAPPEGTLLRVPTGRPSSPGLTGAPSTVRSAVSEYSTPPSPGQPALQDEESARQADLLFIDSANRALGKVLAEQQREVEELIRSAQRRDSGKPLAGDSGRLNKLAELEGAARRMNTAIRDDLLPRYQRLFEVLSQRPGEPRDDNESANLAGVAARLSLSEQIVRAAQDRPIRPAAVEETGAEETGAEETGGEAPDKTDLAWALLARESELVLKNAARAASHAAPSAPHLRGTDGRLRPAKPVSGPAQVERPKRPLPSVRPPDPLQLPKVADFEAFVAGRETESHVLADLLDLVEGGLKGISQDVPAYLDWLVQMANSAKEVWPRVGVVEPIDGAVPHAVGGELTPIKLGQVPISVPPEAHLLLHEQEEYERVGEELTQIGDSEEQRDEERKNELRDTIARRITNLDVLWNIVVGAPVHAGKTISAQFSDVQSALRSKPESEQRELVRQEARKVLENFDSDRMAWAYLVHRLAFKVESAPPPDPARMTEPKWRARAIMVSDLAVQAKERKETTTDKFMNPDGSWHSDRALVHERIIKELSEAPGVPREGKAILIGGMPGSGKSTLLEETVLKDKPPKYVVVDPDEITVRMISHGLISGTTVLSPLEAAEIDRDEVLYLRAKLENKILTEKTNVIISMSMGAPDQITGRLETLKKKGYEDVSALFVHNLPAVARQSYENRYRKELNDWMVGKGIGGRFIPDLAWDGSSAREGKQTHWQIFNEHRHLFERWALYQRDSPEQAPYLVTEGGPDLVSPLTYAQWDDHVTKIRDKLAEPGTALLATHLTFREPDGAWKRERSSLHHSIVEDLYKAASSVPRERRAVFAGGLWPAGAYARSKRDLKDGQYLVIDQSAIELVMAKRGLIPKVEGLTPMETVVLVQDEAAHIADLLLARAAGDQRNVVIVGHLADREHFSEQILQLYTQNYHIATDFLDVTQDIADQQDDRQHRLDHEQYRSGVGYGGRYVPPGNRPADFAGGPDSIKRNFEALRARLDDWRHFVQGAEESEPRLVASVRRQGTARYVRPTPPGKQILGSRRIISSKQRAALTKLGYEADFHVTEVRGSGSFFTALARLAGHAANAALPTDEGEIRRRMIAALDEDLRTDRRYEQYLPARHAQQLRDSRDTGTGGTAVSDPLDDLRRQLQAPDPMLKDLDADLLAALAPHIAADALNLRLAVMGALGKVYRAGATPDRNHVEGQDGRALMLIRLPDGRFAAARAELKGGVRRAKEDPAPWPDTRRIGPDELEELISQEVEQAVLDNSARIQLAADLARLDVVENMKDRPSLMSGSDKPALWEQVLGTIERTLRPGDVGASAMPEFRVLDAVLQDSLYTPENRRRQKAETRSLKPVLLSSSKFEVPDDYPRKPGESDAELRDRYAEALAGLAARLDQVEEIKNSLETLTEVDKTTRERTIKKDVSPVLYMSDTVIEQRDLAQQLAEAARAAAQKSGQGEQADAAASKVFRDIGLKITIGDEKAGVREDRRDIFALAKYATQQLPHLSAAAHEARNKETVAQEALKTELRKQAEAHARTNLIVIGDPYQPNSDQYRALQRERLRPVPGLKHDRDAFFASIIKLAGDAHLRAALRSHNAEPEGDVTPEVLRKFLADHIEQSMLKAEGELSAADLANQLRGGRFTPHLSALVPRLAAESLALNLTILGETGALHELAHYEGQPLIRLLWTSISPDDEVYADNYVALESGMPPQGRPKLESAVPLLEVPKTEVPRGKRRLAEQPTPSGLGLPQAKPSGRAKSVRTARTKGAPTMATVASVAASVLTTAAPPRLPGVVGTPVLPGPELGGFDAVLDAARTLHRARDALALVTSGREEADDERKAEYEKLLRSQPTPRQIGIAEALKNAEEQARVEALKASVQVREAAAKVPPWTFLTVKFQEELERQREIHGETGMAAEAAHTQVQKELERQQEINAKAADVAAELARARVLVSAAQAASEVAHTVLTNHDIATWMGELGYLNFIHQIDERVEIPKGLDEEKLNEPVIKPSHFDQPAAVLSTTELTQVATTPRRVHFEDESENDAALRQAARAKEQAIRETLALKAKLREDRQLPDWFRVHLERVEEKGALAVGEQQRYLAWGQKGRVEKIGDEWLDSGEKIAQQIAAALPARYDEYRNRVEEAITKLFADERSLVAGRRLVSGFKITVDGHTFEVRLVLGQLSGDDGPKYVPAHEVEQHRPIGARRDDPVDQRNQMSGSTSWEDETSWTTTLPLEPSFTPHIAALSNFNLFKPVGGSLVLGRTNAKGGSEYSDVVTTMETIHSKGSAYFLVPKAPAEDVETGSHLEVKVDGHIVSRSEKDVLLAFPLEQSLPKGQPPPLPLGAPPSALHSAPRPEGVPDAGQSDLIKLPDDATPEQAQAFHGAVFAVAFSVVAMPMDDGRQGLKAQILRLFARPTRALTESVNRELTERNVVARQGLVLSSGHITPEVDLDDKDGAGTGWARFKLTARARSVQRIGGTRRDYRRLDIRHNTNFTAEETKSGQPALYIDTTVSFPVTDHGKLTITAPLWLSLYSQESRNKSGTAGGGDWHNLGYEADLVLYAVDVRYLAEVSSSENTANEPVTSDGYVFLEVPVEETARFESLLRRAAGELIPEIVTDGPPVDKLPPPTIRAARARSAGLIDIQSGAQLILPEIMRLLREAENAPDLHLAWGQHRDERDWLRLEAELQRDYSVDALMPNSGVLLSGGVHHGRKDRRANLWVITAISVTRAPARGDPKTTRKGEGRIDYYPFGYADAGAAESQSPGIELGIQAPTIALTLPNGHKEANSYGPGLGYYYDRSVSNTATVHNTASSWTVGWAHEGPLLQTYLEGDYVIKVNVTYRFDVMTPKNVIKFPIHLGKLAWAGIRGRKLPKLARVIKFSPTPTPIKGMQRNVFPEPLAVNAGTPLLPLEHETHRADAIVRRNLSSLPFLAKKTADAPLFERIIGQPLGPKGVLGPSDLPVSVPGLPAIYAAIEDLARDAGIPDELIQLELPKKFNEDVVLGRLQGGARRPKVTFPLDEDGFFLDDKADVVVEFSFYGMKSTDLPLPLQLAGFHDNEPQLKYEKSKSRSHTFYFKPFAATVQPDAWANNPASGWTPNVGLQRKVWNRERGRSKKIYNIIGPWNVHQTRLYSLWDSTVVAEITLTRRGVNSVGALVPSRYAGYVIGPKGLDFFRPPPRPRLLPPPGVPQVLPAAQMPLLNSSIELSFAGQRQLTGAPDPSLVPGTMTGAGAPLNELQQAIEKVLKKIGASTESEWVIAGEDGMPTATLEHGGVPRHLNAITEVPALIAQVPVMRGPGLHLVEVDSGAARTRHAHLLIRVIRGEDYSFDDSGAASFVLFSQGWTQEEISGSRTEQQRATVLWDQLLTSLGLSSKVASIGEGNDPWSHNYENVQTMSRSSAKRVEWLKRNTLTANVTAHYYVGGVQFTVLGWVATVPSLPANIVTLGTASPVAGALRGQPDLGHPEAREVVKATEKVMFPDDVMPVAGRPAGVPRLQPLRNGPQPQMTLTQLIRDENQRHLPLTEQDLQKRRAVFMQFSPEILQELHDHVWAALNGIDKPDEWPTSSKAVKRMMKLGGPVPVAFTTMLSPNTLSPHAPELLADEGLIFPDQIQSLGLLTGKFNATAKMAFYDAVPGVWMTWNQKGDEVDRHKWLETSGSADSTTMSEAVGPDLTMKEKVASSSSMPTVVHERKHSSSAQTVKRLVEFDTYNRTGPQLNVHAGALLVLEFTAVNKAGELFVPKKLTDPSSRAHKIFAYIAGGKARVAYRMDHSALLQLAPETALKLRILTSDGIPLPYGRYLPHISDNPESDVARLKAAASLHPYGNWYPLFAHYDYATDRVLMTETGADGPKTSSLTVEQVADLIRGDKRWDHRPIVLMAGSAARLRPNGEASFAARLGEKLNVNVIGSLDGVLQHKSRNLAVRFSTDISGELVPGTWRQGNFVLFPAVGDDPMLLGDDLERVWTAELPLRMRGAEVSKIHGAAEPEKPVAWGGPSPASQALGALKPSITDVGTGLVVEKITGARGAEVLLIRPAGEAGDGQRLADRLPKLPSGHVAILPEPGLSQDKLAQALDVVLADQGLDGKKVLLMIAGAGGPDGLAHRLQLRNQELLFEKQRGLAAPSPKGTSAQPAPFRFGGPVIIAPAGQILSVGTEGLLFTSDPANFDIEWWEFGPNARPKAIGALLGVDPPPMRTPISFERTITARPIPAGYFVSFKQATVAEIMELTAIPFGPNEVRIVIGADELESEATGRDYLGAGVNKALEQLENHKVDRRDVVVDIRSIGGRRWPRRVDEEDLKELARTVNATILATAPAGAIRPEAGSYYIYPDGKMVDGPAAPRPVAVRLLGLPAGNSRPQGLNVKANGAQSSDLHGDTEVWATTETQDKRPTWRPFAQWLSGDSVVGVLPRSSWLRPGHGLASNRGSEDVLAHRSIDGAEVEITKTGLWIRDESSAPVDAQRIRAESTVPDGAVIMLGTPGRKVSKQEWALAQHLTRYLRRTEVGAGVLKVLAHTDDETLRLAARLADDAGLEFSASFPPAKDADLRPRVALSGVLPAHRVPYDELPSKGPVAIPPLPPLDRPVDLAHGIPAPSARVPAGRQAEAGGEALELGETVKLDGQVRVNRDRIERAYVVLRRDSQLHATTSAPLTLNDIKPGSGPDARRLRLPPEGFFQAVIRTERPPASELEPGDVVIRVSIPTGAAILPQGIETAAVPGAPDTEVWLAPNTLARIGVNKAYVVDSPLGNAIGTRTMRTARPSGDLASFTARVPQVGDARVTAPVWAWSDDEIFKFFMSGSEEIDAGWWFRDTSGTAATSSDTGISHRIPRIDSETVLLFPVDKQNIPVLNGRVVSPEEFARVLSVLISRHPGLDEPVFRLGAYTDHKFVREVAKLTGRPIIAANTKVHITGPGLLDGTLMATDVRSDTMVPIMPPNGQWLLFRPDLPADKPPHILTAPHMPPRPPDPDKAAPVPPPTKKAEAPKPSLPSAPQIPSLPSLPSLPEIILTTPETPQKTGLPSLPSLPKIIRASAHKSQALSGLSLDITPADEERDLLAAGEGWVAAAPGKDRGYKVNTDTGVMVLADRTVLSLDGGWVASGEGLLHRASGVRLSDEGAVVRPGGAQVAAEPPGVAGAVPLSRQQLVDWLTARAVLGWELLDRERGLTVPTGLQLAGQVTSLEGWRVAPGKGRGYAVHVGVDAAVHPGTGVVVLADQTVLTMSGGWVHRGDGLLHRSSGVLLNGDATVGRLSREQLERELADGLAGAESLSGGLELLNWLASHGGVEGPVPGLATGREWQPVHGISGGRQFAYNGPGEPQAHPPELLRGTASGEGMRCLIDSLSQLLRPLLPAGDRGTMTKEYLTSWMRENLPQKGEALEQVMRSQMIDVNSVLPTFTENFKVRVQVIGREIPEPEIIGSLSDPIVQLFRPAQSNQIPVHLVRTWLANSFTLSKDQTRVRDALKRLASMKDNEDARAMLPQIAQDLGVGIQVRYFSMLPDTTMHGPALDQQGKPTPILHLRYASMHFDPLFDPGSLWPEYEEVRGQVERQLENARTGVIQKEVQDAFRQDLADIEESWTATNQIMSPEERVTAMRDLLTQLSGLRDTFGDVIAQAGASSSRPTAGGTEALGAHGGPGARPSRGQLSEEDQAFADANKWWFPGNDPRTHGKTREGYAPKAPQRAWLTNQWLQVIWASADGDCSFHAAVATAGQKAIRASILRAAKKVNLPVPEGGDSVAGLLNQAIDAAREALPDGKARDQVTALPKVQPDGQVTGQHLRLFLAYIAEKNPYIWSPGEGFFDRSEEPADDSITWKGLVEKLRMLGDFAAPHGEYFTALIRYVLTVPVAVLLENGVLSTKAEPFKRSEYLLDIPEIEQPYVIVLIDEHYLGTVRRTPD